MSLTHSRSKSSLSARIQSLDACTPSRYEVFNMQFPQTQPNFALLTASPILISPSGSFSARVSDL